MLTITNKVQKPDQESTVSSEYADWNKLGCVAPCQLTAVIKEPVEICAGLDGTSRFWGCSPRLRFYVDDVPIGESEYPHQMTDSLVLPPGLHSLSVRVVDSVVYPHGINTDDSRRLSVWVYRAGRQQSNPQNTVFLTPAVFDTPETRNKKISTFLDSAQKNNIPVQLYDTEKTWSSFYEHKIAGFLSQLYRLKATQPEIEYVWSIDSRDIVFRYPIQTLLGKFNAMYNDKVIIATDLGGVIHPLFYPFLYGGIQKLTGRKVVEINTGVICGHIDKLIELYEIIQQLRREFLYGIARTELTAKLLLACKENPNKQERLQWQNDDQAHHFLGFISRPDLYDLDEHKKLSAFIHGYPLNPKMTDSPYKLNSIRSAPILHASVPATEGHWDYMVTKQWWTCDEIRLETVPVNIPVLEIPVVYECNLKCRQCTHCAEFANGQVDFEDLRQWLSDWQHKIIPSQIKVTGGEPFLHKNLDWCVGKIRETWPTAHIDVLTNGTVEYIHENLLPSLAKIENVQVILAQRSEEERYIRLSESFIESCKNAGLLVQVAATTVKRLICYCLKDEKPIPFESNAKRAWEACLLKYNCTTLLDGRLFRCPRSALFQRAYRKGELGTEWKIVDTYKPLDPDCTHRELADFIASRIPQSVCRTCPEKMENIE